MRKALLTTTAACVLTVVAGPSAFAGSGTDAFIGGALGGVLGGVIGNAISKPSPPPAVPPPQKEIIYIDREPTRVIERPAPVRRVVPVHGMTRADLADLQNLLNRYGAYHGFTAGVPDGIYGPTTRRAVSEFQSLRGLPVTGTPSYPLLAEARRAIHELEAPETLPVRQKQMPQVPAPAAPPSVEAQKIEVNVVTAPPAQPVQVVQPAQPTVPQAAGQPALPTPPPAAAAARVESASLTNSGGPATIQRTTAAAVAMLAQSALQAQAYGFEVAGVHLSATRVGAKTAIRQFSPSAAIQDVVETAYADLAGLRTEYVSRITATLADDGGRTDRVEIWFGPNPDEDSAAFLVRTMQFGVGARPTVAAIEQSLISKYGAPHLAQDGVGRRTLSWSFTPAGSPAAGATSGLCADNIGDGLLTQPTEAARGVCGFVMVADITSPGGVVSDLVLRVRDLDSYFERLDRSEQTRLEYARGVAPVPAAGSGETAVQPVKF